MLVTAPSVSFAVCSLGVKAYQFSRTSNSRNLRLCGVDKFIRTKKFAKPRRLNLGSEKISRKAALITVHLKNVRTLLMSKLPLHMENAQKRSSYSGLFTRKTSPHSYGLKDLVEALLEFYREPCASRDPKRIN